MTVTNMELWQPTPRSTFNEILKMRKAITEDGIIDFISSLSPWLASSPSALFVQKAAISHLGVSWEFGWVIAIVIETLGLTTTHTALAFHKWNRAHPNSPEKQAPYGLAVSLAGLYVLVTLGLIVVLESVPSLSPYAPIMFPLLAVVGAVNLAMRGHHNQRVREELMTIDSERNRRYQVEDEERQFKHKLAEKKLNVKLGIAVNDVNSGVNDVNDTILTPTDSIQKMLEGRQRKTEERRNKVAALIAEGKTVQEIAAMGIGSLNTIKNDVKEMGD